ncbi:MAG: InlB B-repeat-containing protein [Oscillospiraceae bacterium]|nr:InlB B-repeat-containing protein [Oscillospiraceae bacterium]
MEELNNNQIPEEEEVQKEEEQIPKFRGLYRYVNISVKQLDMIIAACILVILIVVAIELMDPGFTVSFNSLGGTDVAPQEQMYGDLIDEPIPPTREGYTFTGWHRDSACLVPWDLETDTIETDTTLYAGWEKTE